jgi:hypothetical protein
MQGQASPGMASKSRRVPGRKMQEGQGRDRSVRQGCRELQEEQGRLAKQGR